MANPNPPAQHAPVATGPAALSAPPNSGLSLASMLNVIGDFPDKIQDDGQTSVMLWVFCIYHSNSHLL
jgi:hypothetical protein